MKSVVMGFTTMSLAGCATVQAPDHRPANWDSVAMEANSWGRKVSGWSIGKDGSGAWWERKNADGTLSPVGPYTIIYHSFEAGPDGFARIQQELADIPDPAPEASVDCENFMTDAVYGTVRITQQATTTETAWNQGCMDDDYVAFMGMLRTANELIEGWGKAAAISSVESYNDNNVMVENTFMDQN